jgi:hypothetical protein
MTKKEIEKNEDVVRETHEHQILACPMTPDELQSENVHLFKILQDQDDLKAQKKSIMADLKSQEEKLAEILLESRKKIRSRQIMRSVPVTLQLNFTKLTATSYRDDTGEQFNERPMTSDEKRMLNAMDPLPGMEDVDEPEPVEPVTDLTPTDPPDTEPMTEAEADAHATEKFGTDVAGVDINGAADLSDDEPEDVEPEDDTDEWGM